MNRVSDKLRPTLAQPGHDVVVDRLVSVLSPIGQHRAILPKAIKRRGKKRKRKTKSGIAENGNENVPGRSAPPEQTTPSPSIREHLLIGFNSVTRHLEALSTCSRKNTIFTTKDEPTDKPRHVAVVFLLRSMDDLIYSHLPTLCHTASLAHPDLPATRLVLLSRSAEKQLSTAMGQSASVSILAVLEDGEQSPGLAALTEYVRENVEDVEVSWLKQAAEGKWLGTQVDVQ